MRNSENALQALLSQYLPLNQRNGLPGAAELCRYDSGNTPCGSGIPPRWASPLQTPVSYTHDTHLPDSEEILFLRKAGKRKEKKTGQDCRLSMLKPTAISVWPTATGKIMQYIFKQYCIPQCSVLDLTLNTEVNTEVISVFIQNCIKMLNLSLIFEIIWMTHNDLIKHATCS